MSRVGKLPIVIPAGVKVDVDGLKITVVGTKGTLSKEFKGDISVLVENGQVVVKPISDTKHAKAMWGTVRNIINNMVKGVTEGFTEELEVNGVGYRANVKGNYLNLTLGKSHNTKIEIPKDIKVEAPKQNVITLSSINNEQLGQFIAIIIKQRPPEPYKGKGIKRKGQYIQRKEGKKG